MNLDQIPAYVLALAWIVGILVSALKGGIEALVPPQNRWHDLLFTVLPVALSIAAMLGYVLTHGGDRFMAVVWGVLSGCGAIGAYTVHTRTRSTATDAVTLQGLSMSTTPPWVPAPDVNAAPPSSAPVGPSVGVAGTPVPPPPPPGGDMTDPYLGATPGVTYSSGPPTP